MTVFARRHQGMFVVDRQTDSFAIARTNIALLGNVRQKTKSRQGAGSANSGAYA